MSGMAPIRIELLGSFFGVFRENLRNRMRELVLRRISTLSERFNLLEFLQP